MLSPDLTCSAVTWQSDNPTTATTTAWPTLTGEAVVPACPFSVKWRRIHKRGQDVPYTEAVEGFSLNGISGVVRPCAGIANPFDLADLGRKIAPSKVVTCRL